ncbi:Fic family protein [Undibacterium sp. Ji83W]|uniref:Fic family protein n=1 Tax=Undibacterium sp. Ji83W TaxID=3413043 RepID=UPI003BF36ABD
MYSSLQIDFEIIGHPEYSKLFGKIECRESETGFLSCLVVLLNLWGVKVRLTHLLGIVPIPHGSLSLRRMHFAIRRLGMQTMPVANRDFQSVLASWPILILNETGPCVVLLKVEADHFVAVIPDYTGLVCKIPFGAEILQQAGTAFAVRMDKLGPAVPKYERKPRMYLLSWQDRYQGTYDRKTYFEFETRLGSQPGAITHRPLPLSEITSSDLFNSHASICPTRPDFYGRYRTFNLKRGDTVFVEHTELVTVVDDLLTLAREHRPKNAREIVQFSAKLFSDFLAIHPFVNANQRMAMQIVTKYLERWQLKMRWHEISSTQFYYWMRLATRGHICLLESGFAANIEST